MADQMKKFLQDHRSELDHAEMPIDIFDKVMEVSIHNKVNVLSSNKNIFQVVWRIAASVMLLIVAIKFLTITDKNNQQFAVHNQQTEFIPQKVDVAVTAMNMDSANGLISHNSAIQQPLSIHKKLRLSTKNVSTHSKFHSSEETVKPSEIRNTQITDVESTLANNHFIPIEVNLTNQQVNNVTAVRQSEVESPVVAYTSGPLITEVSKNTEDQYLGHKVRKGLFAFLSKKSRKWTNNALSIDPIETNKKTYLAFNFNNKNLSFNRSLRIYNNQ